MTQEEKARAYDKAIEKIKYVMANGVSPTLNKEDLEDIFSELKESEDEKIRKAILDHLTMMWGNGQDDVCGVHVEDAIAWLDKQGEQKSPILSNSSNIGKKWTEEDEELFQHCCGAVAAADYYTLEDKEEMENWLKSLKKRMEEL